MLDNITIGRQIAVLRKEKGLTGEKLAELLGISPQAISKWENGKCLPETSLLAELSCTLGCSIDTLLMPKELLVLSAVYSDGVKHIDVTPTVNNLIHGNQLNITVNSQFLSASIDSSRVKILTVKFQNPKGLFYSFAAENTSILLNSISSGYENKSLFRIMGAYYGNDEDYRCVMQKMEHYNFFNWNEINVNHENFPSSTSSDETEYLTLIYSNEQGVFTISCEETESLCYNNDKTYLYLKDNSSCILPDIIMLNWEENMDCTWAGSIYASLKYMGEDITYEQIMGISGACYRLSFTDVWDWSAVDALVSFDYSSVLFKAIGYESIWADRIDKAERKIERKKIVNDIINGKPVIAINLRIAPEWGVITGYLENGKRLLCRTYFDKPVFDEHKNEQAFLNQNGGYLETDFWPFMIVHFGEKIDKPSLYENLKASLKALIDSFNAPCERGYFQGREAYKSWINALKNDELWHTDQNKEDVDRRLSVNDSMLLNLIDARRCAAVYLKESIPLLSNEGQNVLDEIADTYLIITKDLSEFRNKLKNSKNDLLNYNVITTKSDYSRQFRQEQIRMLEQILLLENTIVEKAKLIVSL